MAENIRLIGPGDEEGELQSGSEVVVPASSHPDHDRTVFSVLDSEDYDELLLLEEQTTDDSFLKARAYFRKGKAVTYELIPDHIKGEEGKRFMRIAGALAAAGAGAYILVRTKSKK